LLNEFYNLTKVCTNKELEDAAYKFMIYLLLDHKDGLINFSDTGFQEQRIKKVAYIYDHKYKFGEVAKKELRRIEAFTSVIQIADLAARSNVKPSAARLRQANKLLDIVRRSVLHQRYKQNYYNGSVVIQVKVDLPTGEDGGFLRDKIILPLFIDGFTRINIRISRIEGYSSDFLQDCFGQFNKIGFPRSQILSALEIECDYLSDEEYISEIWEIINNSYDGVIKKN